MSPGVDLLRAVLALIFTLGLIWLLGMLLRKHGWKLGLPAPMQGGTTKRLRMIEVLTLDPKNKLVLVQRDNKQHLILLGMQNSELIETLGPEAPLEQGTAK